MIELRYFAGLTAEQAAQALHISKRTCVLPDMTPDETNIPPARRSLRELFDAALALPPEQRNAFIAEQGGDDEQRSRLTRLLANADDAADPEGVLPRLDVAQLVNALAEEAPVLPPDARIGSFELLEVLGEGGSSTVFRAARTVEGVRQEVALKLLRRPLHSPDARRQFRREQSALAQLHHPAIARLIEGGITETGLAYIALELVDGAPITVYARTQQLDLRARLRLFLQVCRAVEAAHRALIVHRDLKPSNVFVTADGEVKLLDFGIAKLLDADDQTQTGLPNFTPAYAAPEQFTGQPITTATDVYALGVLLGELLTGQHLNDEPSRTRTPSSAITDDTAPGVLPATPAITRRQLRGDLDNVVLKAIEAEPARRYATAAALADDVQRLLDQRPVSAHPPSRWYRTHKFIARNRGAVAATALFTLGIFAALGIALWQGYVAQREAERSDAMRDFIVTAFAEAKPSTPREGPPRIDEVVNQAIEKVRNDTRMNPDVRSELLSQLGAVLMAQGRTREALETLQWNYGETAKTFSLDTPQMQRAGFELADAEHVGGDAAKSRKIIDALLVEAGDTALTADLYFLSAKSAIRNDRDFKRALIHAERGLRIARARNDENALAQAVGEYGLVNMDAGDYLAAERALLEMLALVERLHGSNHIQAAEAHGSLARVYHRLGRFDEAERQARAALAIDDQVLPKEHQTRAAHVNALLLIQSARRDLQGGLVSAEEILRINQAFHDDAPNYDVALALNNVGVMRSRLEDFSGAVEPLRQSLAQFIALYGPEYYETAKTRSEFGAVLAQIGDVANGEAELLHAIATFDALPEHDYDASARAWAKLARVRLDRNAANEALIAIASIDAQLAKLNPPSPYWDGRANTLRAAALLQQRKPDEALRVLGATATAQADSEIPDAELRTEILLLQATAARALGQEDEARRYAQTGLDALASLRNPPSRLITLAAPFTTPPR